MKKACLGLLSVALLAMVAIAAEEKKEEFGKCPVSGKAAVGDKTVDYKGGKVYLCCAGCPDAFKKDTAKFAAKANQQLVVTGQFTEAKCPLSGGKLNPDTGIDVSGTTVKFCCNNCKGKVAAKSGNEQLEMVFNDTAFGKGFEAVAKKEKKDK